MANTLISLPFEYFPDPDRGRPLFNGLVYVGEPDTDPNDIPSNLKSLIDANGTPVANPITLGVGGVPQVSGAAIEVLTTGNYSLLVVDEDGAQQYYVRNRFEGVPASEPVITTFETLADLRANASATISTARVLGRFTIGDGGDATYQKDPGSAESDDGFLYIQDALAQVWALVVPDVINVQLAGADPTGVTASHDELKLAINYAADNGRLASLGGGEYLVTQVMGCRGGLLGPGKITASIATPGRTGMILVDPQNGGDNSIYTATTISFNAANNSIVDSASGLGQFNVGDVIYYTGSAQQRNVGSATVQSASNGELILRGPDLVDEAAGATIYVYKQFFIKFSGFETDAQGTSGSFTLTEGSDNTIIEDVVCRNAFFAHISCDSSSQRNLHIHKPFCRRVQGFTSGLGNPSFGDGIAYIGVVDGIMEDCVMADFTRIGFLCEGQQTPLLDSLRPRIINCTGRDVAANPPGENVSAGWVERTTGAYVENLTAHNLVNTGVSFNAYGFVGNAGNAETDDAQTGNIINGLNVTDTYVGMQKGGFMASNLRFSRGHIGLMISSGDDDVHHRDRVIRNVQFTDMILDVDKTDYYNGVGSAQPPSCLVLINGGGFGDLTLDTLSVVNCTPDSAGTPGSQYADIYIAQTAADATPQVIGPISVTVTAATRTIVDTSASLSAVIEGNVLELASASINGRFVVASSETVSGTTTLTLYEEKATGSLVDTTENVTFTRYRDVYKSITIKNCTTDPDRSLTVKNVKYHTVMDLKFENVPLAHDLGSLYTAWDSMEFTRCALTTGNPSNSNLVRGQVTRFEGCNPLWGMRTAQSTTAGSNVVLINNTCDEDVVIRPTTDNTRLRAAGNLLYGFEGAWVVTDAAITVRATFFNNELIANGNNGKLVSVSGPTDVIVLHDNVQTNVASPLPYVDNTAGAADIRAIDNEFGV